MYFLAFNETGFININGERRGGMKVFSVLLILIIALPIKSPRIFSREVLFEISRSSKTTD